MANSLRLKLASGTAEQIIKEMNIVALPIDPFFIAQAKGIVVVAMSSSDHGVSGMLARYGDTFGIMYSTNIDNEGFQRFSVAHELGHYFLESHVEKILIDDKHYSDAGFNSNCQYELEADHFAANLLMPEFLFKPEAEKLKPGLQTIKTMADICRTSLISTAIRYAQLTDYIVAIIVSTEGIVDYCFMSEAMKLLPDLRWISKGDQVPHATVTSQLRSESAEDEIYLSDWFDGNRSILAREETINLGNYGKVLTILSSEEAMNDNDYDDQTLENSWNPSF